MAAMEAESTSYSVTDLTSLDKLEPVRMRPGMYIGNTGSRGLHHCLWEILDNAIDEITNGYGDTAVVTLHKDRSATVSDNGRGVPVEIHPEKKISGVEMVYTELHTGGKFNNKNYKTAGGLHGVGGSVVNALSKWFEVEVFKNGRHYYMRFEHAFDKKYGKVMPGTPVTKLETKGKTQKSGTKVHFLPDREIFGDHTFRFELIDERMKELSFQNKGITLKLIDERGEEVVEATYHSENGLLDFIAYLNESKQVIHPKPILFEGERHINDQRLQGEVCIQFTDSSLETIASYVNNIPTSEAGTHETGFKTGMTRAFKEMGRKTGLMGGKDDFEGDDLREGMTAIVKVRLTNPIFEGQTKNKLGNQEAQTLMADLTYTKLSEWIEDNKDVAGLIINNAVEAAKRREKIKKISDLERKKIGKGTSPLTGKVMLCNGRNRAINEFIVVEGDSAGGTAKKARDTSFQAIMPSRGKIMNTEKQKLENVLASEELKIFNAAIGTGTLDNYREEDLKYNKIIIMSDADVDGYHIRTLWMTYVYRYMRPLITNGHLYLAQPPLYRVYKKVKEKGKEREISKYCYNEEELEAIKKEIGSGYHVQRYKGLGEMNDDQLWDTTLNPETRTLLRVTIDDAAKAERMVSLLMGDVVEPRKNYMYAYAEF